MLGHTAELTVLNEVRCFPCEFILSRSESNSLVKSVSESKKCSVGTKSV